MNAEPSIAERLSSVASALRSPLCRDLAGDLSGHGQSHVAGLQDILDELPQIAARGAEDALALTMICNALVNVLAANAEGNQIALAAAHSLGAALRSLTACLSDLAGRPASDFAIGEAPKPLVRQ